MEGKLFPKGIHTLRGGGTDDYSVDSLTNRYTAIDGSPLAYDAAGNLTREKDGYGYDYENRIVEIRSSADVVIVQMDYDTQGRRIRVILYDSAASAKIKGIRSAFVEKQTFDCPAGALC